MGHDKMLSGADLWGGTPLVNSNHVIDSLFHFLQQFVYNNPQP